MQHKKTTTPLQAFTDRIERFVQRNPIRSDAKAIVDDLVQLQFNMLPVLGGLYYAPRGQVWLDHQHPIANTLALDEYVNHPDALQELTSLSDTFLGLVAESQPFTDVLGPFYGTSIARRQTTMKGQYLTPPELSEHACRFTPDTLRIAAPTVPYRVGDFTCGSGALLLAHLAQRVEALGSPGATAAHVILNDIDPAMVRLAAVQIGLSSLMHGVPIGCVEVHCGDLIADYRRKTLVMVITPDAERRAMQEREMDARNTLFATAAA